MVREERLELSRLAAPDPKSGVYTNFTTLAQWEARNITPSPYKGNRWNAVVLLDRLR